MAIASVVCWAAALASLCVGEQIPLASGSRANHALHLTHDLLEFHRNISSIESISGNENAVGEWLADSLTDQGYHVERQYISKEPSRFNVLAWPGHSRSAPVLLSSHIDVVPPYIPYKRTGPEGNSTISGRGTVDAKGSVATQILAVNELLESGEISPDDVAVLYVVGEEVHGEGMRAANALELKPRTVIFGEPTEAKLVSGHKGNTGVTIRAKGRAAHSGYPWLGRSATEILVRALAALMDLSDQLPSSDKYGATTFNIGQISGGVAGNVVAENASAVITIRIAAGTPEFIKDKVTTTVHAAVREFLDDPSDSTATASLRPEDIIELAFASQGYAPIDIDADVPGFDVITVNYGTDIPWLHKASPDQKRYLYGPGSIFVAHSDHEGLQEQDLFRAVSDYKRIILHALGK